MIIKSAKQIKWQCVLSFSKDEDKFKEAVVKNGGLNVRLSR